LGTTAALLDDADRLSVISTTGSEPISFILAEEILWAGDHKKRTNSSRAHADTFQIERKHGAIKQAPNRLHMIMTTNHDHAISAWRR